MYIIKINKWHGPPKLAVGREADLPVSQYVEVYYAFCPLPLALKILKSIEQAIIKRHPRQGFTWSLVDIAHIPEQSSQLWIDEMREAMDALGAFEITPTSLTEWERANAE